MWSGTTRTGTLAALFCGVAMLVAACGDPTSRMAVGGALETASEAASEAASAVASEVATPASPVLIAAHAPGHNKTPPQWRAHFDDISRGAILVNLHHRSLTYWSPGGGEVRQFPVATPRSEDLQRLGRTSVVRRRKNPDWRPTPSMKARDPELPDYIGPGPQNPLGERALYLGWQYYAIHGTNNPLSIGSRATSGCFRLHPDDILWLFDRVEIGAPVRVVSRLAP